MEETKFTAKSLKERIWADYKLGILNDIVDEERYGNLLYVDAELGTCSVSVDRYVDMMLNIPDFRENYFASTELKKKELIETTKRDFDEG